MRVCDYCHKELNETEFDISIRKPTKFKSFSTCSEECFSKILAQNGFPNEIQDQDKGKSSLKLSKIALATSTFALALQIIRAILSLL